MNFCPNCGEPTNDSDKNCSACGAVLVEDAPKESSRVLSPAEDAKAHVFASILAYLPIICILPSISCKKSPFLRFHVNQGICLFILEIFFLVVSCLLPKTAGADGILEPYKYVIMTAMWSLIVFYIYSGIRAAIQREKRKMLFLSLFEFVRTKA